VLALVDESPTVRTMAKTLIMDVMTKSPTLAHNHFLEVMFLLNGCSALWRKARRRQPAGAEAGMHLELGSSRTAARLSGAAPAVMRLRFVVYKVRCCLMRIACAHTHTTRPVQRSSCPARLCAESARLHAWCRLS
jgi:hypothetical protein